MANLNEQLYQAVDEIIKARLNTLQMDQTHCCTVIGQVQDEENKYWLSKDSVKFQALSKSDELFTENDQVYVMFQANGEKIILGRYVSSSDNPIAYKDPIKQMLPIQEFYFIPQKEEFFIRDVQLSTMSSSQGPFTKVGAEFYFSSTEEVNPEGKYWVALDFFDTEGKVLNPQIDGISTLLYSSDYIYGNPYTVLSNIPNKIVWDIKDLTTATTARLSQQLIDGISLETVKFYFGYDLKSYLEKDRDLFLYTLENTSLTYTENTQTVDIHCLLLDKTNELRITELKDNQFIRWYKYTIGAQGDQFGGGYWTYIDNESDNPFILSKNSYSFDTNTINTQFKAVLCSYNLLTEKPGNWKDGANNYYVKNDNNDFSLVTAGANWEENKFYELVLSQSEPIAFINETSNFLDTEENKYFTITGENFLNIYNSNNKVISDSYYTLKLQPIAGTQDTIITEGTSIIWDIGPEDNMIEGFYEYDEEGTLQKVEGRQKTVIADADGWDNTLIYKPSSEFNINNSYTRVQVTVADQYKASFGINFAYANTQGTNYTFKIVPADNTDVMVNTIGSTLNFKAVLYVNGVEQVIDPNKLEWSWEQKEQYEELVSWTISSIPYVNKDSRRIKKDYIDLNNNKNFVNLVLKREFAIQYQPFIFEDILSQKYYRLSLKPSDWDLNYDKYYIWSNNTYVLNTSSNYNANTYYAYFVQVKQFATACNSHILKATYKANVLYETSNDENGIVREIELVDYYPVKVRGADNNTEFQTTPEGVFSLAWNEQNQLQDSYDIDETNGYFIKDRTYKEGYRWQIISENDNEDYSIINNQLYLGINYPSFNKDKRVISATLYTGGTTALYQQPLMTSISRYGSELTNKWAGASIKIDEDDATIMATTMGAGHKNDDNSFTGVIFGDMALHGKANVQTGLFGFDSNQMVFKLDSDANFFVGNKVIEHYYDTGEIKKISGNFIEFDGENFELRIENKFYLGNDNNYIKLENDIIKIQSQSFCLLTNGLKIDSNGEILNWIGEEEEAIEFFIWAGEPIDNGFFGVTNSGKLYALDAKISGTIEADSGSIGGWEIDGNILKSNDGSIQLNSENNKISIKNTSFSSTTQLINGDKKVVDILGIDGETWFSNGIYAKGGIDLTLNKGAGEHIVPQEGIIHIEKSLGIKGRDQQYLLRYTGSGNTGLGDETKGGCTRIYCPPGSTIDFALGTSTTDYNGGELFAQFSNVKKWFAIQGGHGSVDGVLGPLESDGIWFGQISHVLSLLCSTFKVNGKTISFSTIDGNKILTWQ